MTFTALIVHYSDDLWGVVLPQLPGVSGSRQTPAQARDLALECPAGD